MTLSHGLRSLIFLSTPSGWRATKPTENPQSKVKISIHPLRVEGDNGFAYRDDAQIVFLSTPSGWRATIYPVITD